MPAAGDALPAFKLPGLDGKRHSSAELEGAPAVVLFGEMYNKSSLAALDELSTLVKQPALEGTSVRRVLVLGAPDPTEKVAKEWEALGKGEDVLVLHDRGRTLFETFGVKVLPTAAIVDPEGRLSLLVSGYPLNFADIVTDAVLHALGKIERERLERTLHPEGPGPADETRLKALRTSRMAAALARRKLHDLAEARFEEALGYDATLLEARLGLADVQLKVGKVQEAQGSYEQVLERAPASVAAHVGLARIEIKRDQLARAEKRLKEQAALHPLHAEVHFVLGEAYEKLGRKDEALSAYKRAAMILVGRSADR